MTSPASSLCSRPHSSEPVFSIEFKLLPLAHRPADSEPAGFSPAPLRALPLFYLHGRPPDCPSYGCALAPGLLLAFPLHSVYPKPTALQGLAQFHLLFAPFPGPPSPNAAYPKHFQSVPGFFSVLELGVSKGLYQGRRELSRRTNQQDWLRLVSFPHLQMTPYLNLRLGLGFHVQPAQR